METYDEILSRMKAKYEERTGTSPDDASDIGVRMKVLAGEVFELQAEYEYVKRQMFPDTAQGEYLDRHAAQRGLTRRSGTKARGEVTFYLETALSYDITIPQGTVVATRGESPERYITTQEIVIASGRTASLCTVEAMNEGKSGNAAAQEITVIVTPVSGITRVVNDYKLTDGSDVESDEQLRRRILDSFVNIPNGTNKAFYIQSALEVDGVRAAGAAAGVRGPGTLDIYIMSDDGEPSDKLKREVKSYLESLREINVDIEIGTLQRIPVNVYVNLSVKSGYEFSDVMQRVNSSIMEYFSLVGAGEDFYLSAVGDYIQHTEGVENYSFITILCSDKTIDDDCIAWPSSVSINERVIR